MPEYLIAMAIGPIQEFIQAGRRTRDLWFGSKLLSDISREGAKAVAGTNGTVIFPGPAALKNPDAGIANVILAKLGEDAPHPAEVARLARAACDGLWRSRAEAARDHAGELVRRDIWNDQLDNVIEFYAAWTTFDPNNYKESRLRVMRLLAARKLVRDFPAWKGRLGVPKSSLDGARESVLVNYEDASAVSIPGDKARQLRLSRGEHLDIVGLTKRLKDIQGFPSVSRIAADTWVRNLPAANLAQLNKICRELADERRVLTAARRMKDGELITVPDDVFPFEGSAIYKTRHHELARENFDAENGAGSLPRVYLPLSRYIEQLEREFGIPDPYVACLQADGDRMGEALSQKTDYLQHQRFSDRLAEFSKQAGEIVFKNYGSLIYSGGDDVLAFVPVAMAIRCAQQLHEAFKHLVVPEAPRATLSVGIAVAHSMEHMEDIRKYAEAAEKHAKRGDKLRDEDDSVPLKLQKNALAIHVHPRGGSPVRIRAQWGTGLPERLGRWVAAYLDGNLSHKSAYDLKSLLDGYLTPHGSGWTDALFSRAFPEDAARALSRKASTREIADEIRDALRAAGSWRGAAAFIDELIVARRFEIAVRQPSKLKGPVGGLLLAD